MFGGLGMQRVSDARVELARQARCMREREGRPLDKEIIPSRDKVRCLIKKNKCVHLKYRTNDDTKVYAKRVAKIY